MSNQENFKEGETILSNEKIDTLLNLEKEFQQEEQKQQVGEAKTAAPFKIKVPIKTAKTEPEVFQQQTADPDFNLSQRIKNLEQELVKLRAGENGVRVAKANAKVVDFTKIKESDVFDLNVPIEAIVHDLPDSTLIKLKDPNYIGRWVNINAMNMGKRKAAGFTFVTLQDLEDGTLMMDLEEDENGHFRYNDVIAMKIPKQKYFGALRANHLRAIAVVNQKKAQEVGKMVAQNVLQKEIDPDTHQSYGRDYQKYASENKIEVYSI